MTDAINAPVRRARRETNTADLEVGQQDPIDMALGSPLDHVQEIETADESVLHKQQMEALAFNEEAILVHVHPSHEQNAPLVVDCWVNGKGAEIWMNGGWREMGCLPVGLDVITKRKYVEALLMAKVTTRRTEVGSTMEERPRNHLVSHTAPRVNLTVREDRNPRGREWLTRVLALKN